MKPTVKINKCFNTQPPEGGWALSTFFKSGYNGFNTQPPEGGWASFAPALTRPNVSTHSRLKAAGIRIIRRLEPTNRFNTQPPEGGWKSETVGSAWRKVSTHSRLKAAGSGFHFL